MNHVTRMQIVHAQTNMDEHFPKEVVGEVFPLLLLDGMTEVAVLAVLHYDANGLLRDERVVVAHHEVAVDLCHDGYLLHRFKSCMLRQYTHVNFLDDISLVSDQLPRLI